MFNLGFYVFSSATYFLLIATQRVSGKMQIATTYLKVSRLTKSVDTAY
jgi:hypothetical protein